MLPGLASIIPGIGKLTGRVISSTASAGSSITCPTVALGDVVIFTQFAANQSSSPGLVTPSGFTNVNYVTYGGFADEYSFASHFKVMSGSEGGSTLTGMSGARDNMIALLVLRLSTKPASASAFSSNIQFINGDVSVQTINPTGITKPALFYGFTYGSYSGTLVTNGTTTTTGYESGAHHWEVQNRPLTSRTIDGNSFCLLSYGLAFNF